jgi:hypothetical protein
VRPAATVKATPLRKSRREIDMAGIRGIADFDRQANGQMMVPLHAFIKNSDKTPPASTRPMTCLLRPCRHAFPPSARKQSAPVL